MHLPARGEYCIAVATDGCGALLSLAHIGVTGSHWFYWFTHMNILLALVVRKCHFSPLFLLSDVSLALQILSCANLKVKGYVDLIPPVEILGLRLIS